MTLEDTFNIVVQTRFGPAIINRHDRYVGQSLAMYGEFSPGESAIFNQVVCAGDVVVEAGANIGAHTVALSRLVGPWVLLHFLWPAITRPWPRTCLPTSAY